MMALWKDLETARLVARPQALRAMKVPTKPHRRRWATKQRDLLVRSPPACHLPVSAARALAMLAPETTRWALLVAPIHALAAA